MKISVIPHIPCVCGVAFSAAVWAIGEEPIPASLRKRARKANLDCLRNHRPGDTAGSRFEAKCFLKNPLKVWGSRACKRHDVNGANQVNQGNRRNDNRADTGFFSALRR
jgi:hypothetical protein